MRWVPWLYTVCLPWVPSTAVSGHSGGAGVASCGVSQALNTQRLVTLKDSGHTIPIPWTRGSYSCWPLGNSSTWNFPPSSQVSPPWETLVTTSCQNGLLCASTTLSLFSSSSHCYFCRLTQQLFTELPKCQSLYSALRWSSTLVGLWAPWGQKTWFPLVYMAVLS